MSLSRTRRNALERVGEAWFALSRKEPQAAALIEADYRVVTRAEINAAVDDWCAAIPHAEALRGRKVALVAANGAAWLAAFLGLLRLGAVAVLLDKGDTEEVLCETARNLGASWLWLQERTTGKGLAKGRWIAFSLRPRLRRPDLCLVKVTSGSTGRPRGMEFTHAQMLADGSQVCASMGIGAADRNLGVIPFGHSYGLGNLVLPLLQQGTLIICADSPLPNVLAEFSERCKPTVFPAVPTLLRALIRSGLPAEPFASLRLVITAGARIEPADAQAFEAQFSKRVHNFYGSSETGGICYDATGEVASSGRSVGRLMEGVRLEPTRGGRFRVLSAAVMKRGAFSPADRGSLSSAGELVLEGRVGRLVKIAGRRLDLAGLEAEIGALAGVRGVVVTLHPKRADSLAALVASEFPVSELRKRLSARLAPWKLPERLRVIAELPSTARGKIDRRRALELLAE